MADPVGLNPTNRNMSTVTNDGFDRRMYEAQLAERLYARCLWLDDGAAGAFALRDVKAAVLFCKATFELRELVNELRKQTYSWDF